MRMVVKAERQSNAVNGPLVTLESPTLHWKLILSIQALATAIDWESIAWEQEVITPVDLLGWTG